MSQQVVKVTWTDGFKATRKRYPAQLAAYFGAPADSLNDAQVALWLSAAGHMKEQMT
jgi:hypothetical protein